MVGFVDRPPSTVPGRATGACHGGAAHCTQGGPPARRHALTDAAPGVSPPDGGSVRGGTSRPPQCESRRSGRAAVLGRPLGSGRWWGTHCAIPGAGSRVGCATRAPPGRHCTRHVREGVATRARAWRGVKAWRGGRLDWPSGQPRARAVLGELPAASHRRLSSGRANTSVRPDREADNHHGSRLSSGAPWRLGRR